MLPKRLLIFSSSQLLQCTVVLIVLLCGFIFADNNGMCYASMHEDVKQKDQSQTQQQQILNEQVKTETTFSNNCNNSGKSSSNCKYFKCQRSFEMLSALPQLSKSNAADNCNFVYFNVVNASTTVLPPSSPSYSEKVATILKRETGGSITETNNKGKNAMMTTNNREEKNANDDNWRVQLNIAIELAPNIHELLASHVGSPEDYFLRENDTVHETELTAKSSSNTNNVKTYKSKNKNKVNHKSSIKPILFEEDDPWRFSVSLQSKVDGSSIHYKGVSTNTHDSNNPGGFSMCCELFDVNHTNCQWMQPQWGDNDDIEHREEPDERITTLIRTITQCELPLKPESSEVETMHSSLKKNEQSGNTNEQKIITLSGSIVKPLHRVIAGPWEAKIQLWRRRANHFTQLQLSSSSSSIPDNRNSEIEMLGRIVIPFYVDDLSDVAEHSSNSSNSSSSTSNKIVTISSALSDQEDL